MKHLSLLLISIFAIGQSFAFNCHVTLPIHCLHTMPLLMAQVAKNFYRLSNKWLKSAIELKISAMIAYGLHTNTPTCVLMAIFGRFIAIAFSKVRKRPHIQYEPDRRMQGLQPRTCHVPIVVWYNIVGGQRDE